MVFILNAKNGNVYVGYLTALSVSRLYVYSVRW